MSIFILKLIIFFSLRLLQIMSIWMHTPMKIPQKKSGYNYTFRQLPPINSLRIEVFGITSLSMARK